MMLDAGLYDDNSRSREIIYNFARLRALRVEVDVKLALGQFTIAQAAEYLARTVPMDRRTAEGEAADFATAPGLGIAYENWQAADRANAGGTAASFTITCGATVTYLCPCNDGNCFV